MPSLGGWPIVVIGLARNPEAAEVVKVLSQIDSELPAVLLDSSPEDSETEEADEGSVMIVLATVGVMMARSFREDRIGVMRPGATR